MSNPPFSPSVFFDNKLLSLPSPNRLFGASPSGKLLASPLLRSPMTTRQREWLGQTPKKTATTHEGKENHINGIQAPPSVSRTRLAVPCSQPPLTLAQQLKSINCKINGLPPNLCHIGGDESFLDEVHDWPAPAIDVRDETIGDSSQSGDDEDNGWKALLYVSPPFFLNICKLFDTNNRLLQRTKEKDAMLAQAEQVIRRTQGFSV